MYPAIDNTVSCEIRAFLHAKNMNAAEIHCELCMAGLQPKRNE
jgi:hypothetical protein